MTDHLELRKWIGQIVVKKHTLSPDEIEKLHNILNGEETKQSVRVSEAQLHQIIRETVETVINEAYSDAH